MFSDPELDPESVAPADEAPAVEIPAVEDPTLEKQGVHVLQMVGWFSAGMVLATLGIVVGVELRSRYKFKKRTPYDFYSSAGKQPAGEFGVGV